MSMASEHAGTVVVAEQRQPDTTSYVDWPAIIVGAIVASAISLVLLTFGSALGLSFTSPFENAGMSAVGLAIALALWLVWVQVSSFMAGGYITGRLRRRMYDATEHESDVRDGMHGLAVWGTGVVVGGLMLAIGASGALGIAAGAAGSAVQAATDITAPNDQNLIDYAIGTAFRSDAPAEAGSTDARADAAAIVAQGIVGGDITIDDRTYLAQIVARQTGLSPEEAQARVDTLATSAQQIATDARNAAERARKFTILAAFIAAASLAISAAGAFWAAGWGGSHRDKGTVIPMWFNRIH